MLRRLADLLFPPKCVLCKKILTRQETDLCHSCRMDAPEYTKSKRNIPFVAQRTGIWYYKDNVRSSIHRFKFGNARRYASPYARLLAVKLINEGMEDFDLITWVPISPERKRKRGYDQGQLLALALGRELQRKPAALLRKIRNAPPQSGISDAAERRANVLGAYQPINCDMIQNKRVLLLDDVLTTGSTASECAKTLLIGGAKDVYLATIGVADKK